MKDGETTDDLFGFLTTFPNAEVKPVHPKAMPVILTTPDEWQAWLHAPWDQAKSLERPLADGALKLIYASTCLLGRPATMLIANQYFIASMHAARLGPETSALSSQLLAGDR